MDVIGQPSQEESPEQKPVSLVREKERQHGLHYLGEPPLPQLRVINQIETRIH